MGCGLRKLEEPDDSSPGKIFSTLKRPQVETKTDISYEYLLLDFTLDIGSSNPDVIKISSLLDLNSKLEGYYKRGYVVATIHPTILSVGRRKQSPLSYIYRVILSKMRSARKKSEQGEQIHCKLVVEEWSVSNQTFSSDVVKGLLDKVNDLAKKGMKFVGFLNQLSSQSKDCNGTKSPRQLDSDCGQNFYFKLPDQRKLNHDNYIKCNEGTLTRNAVEFAVEREHLCSKVTNVSENGPATEEDLLHGREKVIGNESCTPVQPKEDLKLFAVFNVSDEDFSGRSYHEGNAALRVTRKGQTICTLEADWLQIMTSYYKSGMSLVDSFIAWETMKGDYLSKSVDGMFIYEENHLGTVESGKVPNDAIVVEQWTVIEDCEVKTDYGPLLHTLAEFGWLVTCVLATPIIRHDSEGNLATKQVMFLQRPATPCPDLHLEPLEKKSTRQGKVSEKNKNWNRNVGVTTSKTKPSETESPEDSCTTSERNLWIKEPSHQYGGISGTSRTDDVFRDLDDEQLDQEEEIPQVTCI
ncbi:raftlin-2 [Scyliorhinus canicula]|uniref:raftlin-2 n=1 Tax=Scyliorhinus canicula TaxID=7830 RepID=UPI0018F7A269|nr:raftlin-2 [Scyliorhinus canicula]XP_038645007.1 raftlin-2 [Scyliorhinus canicula]